MLIRDLYIMRTIRLGVFSVWVRLDDTVSMPLIQRICLERNEALTLIQNALTSGRAI